MGYRIFVLAAAVLASTAAIADTERYVATLAQPLSAKKEFVANGNIWKCDGSTCTLSSRPVQAGTLGSCRRLQLQAGTLTAYGTPEKPFDADTLAKCNSK